MCVCVCVWLCSFAALKGLELYVAATLTGVLLHRCPSPCRALLLWLQVSNTSGAGAPCDGLTCWLACSWRLWSHW